MVQKIHAAVDTRSDTDLVIVARTDAIAANGFNDAMDRAAAYIEAGADMTFVEAPKTIEEMSQISKRLAVPQIVNIVAGGLTPMLGFDELAKMGFSMILYANAALQASIAGMQKVLGHLKAQGSLAAVSDQLAGFEERQRIVLKPHFGRSREKILGTRLVSMANETRALAGFAASLSFDDIPDAVIHRTKQCIADTVAAMIFGASLPWSRMVSDYAIKASADGRSTIVGTGGRPVQPGAAALAMGTAAHAYELDSLRRPGAGVHPGATLVPPALAMAQHLGKGGKDVILAFVAGCEVLFRVGDATRHSAESAAILNAPGLTGPLGAAVVAGKLLGLDADKMANALGIAGSLASGLLEFSNSGSGGTVKRLHLGRAGGRWRPGRDFGAGRIYGSRNRA